MLCVHMCVSREERPALRLAARREKHRHNSNPIQTPAQTFHNLINVGTIYHRVFDLHRAITPATKCPLTPLLERYLTIHLWFHLLLKKQLLLCCCCVLWLLTPRWEGRSRDHLVSRHMLNPIPRNGPALHVVLHLTPRSIQN